MLRFIAFVAVVGPEPGWLTVCMERYRLKVGRFGRTAIAPLVLTLLGAGAPLTEGGAYMLVMLYKRFIFLNGLIEG